MRNFSFALSFVVYSLYRSSAEIIWTYLHLSTLIFPETYVFKVKRTHPLCAVRFSPLKLPPVWFWYWQNLCYLLILFMCCRLLCITWSRMTFVKLSCRLIILWREHQVKLYKILTWWWDTQRIQDYSISRSFLRVFTLFTYDILTLSIKHTQASCNDPTGWAHTIRKMPFIIRSSWGHFQNGFWAHFSVR